MSIKSASRIFPIKDPRVDEYISKSADFAKPVLQHIRQLMHIGCPELEECIKWSQPFFEYKGSILGNMAAFTHHCSLGLWNASLLKDPHHILHLESKESSGSFGRITSLKDFPADKLIIELIREAVGYIDKGILKPLPTKKPKDSKLKPSATDVPQELLDAFKTNKKAGATFEAFSPSHKKEYLEWILEAKTEETRHKRIATTIEWLTDGKTRHWKYRK